MGGIIGGIVVEEVRDSVVKMVCLRYIAGADYYIWWCSGVVPMV